MKDIQFNKFITSNFIENDVPRFYKAIGKEYNLKYRPDKTAQDSDVTNSGIDDDSIVFETVKTYVESISDDLLEIKNNQIGKTHYSRLLDSRGEEVYSTEANQLMVTESQRSVGGVFNGSYPDANFFTTVLLDADATIVNSELNLSVTAITNSSSLIYTNTRARCIGGNMNQYRERLRLNTLSATNNTRRWGLTENNAFTNTVYFQFKNNTLSVVAKTNGLSDIVVNSGAFNGSVSSYVMDTNYHLYTINYVNGLFKLYIDDSLIHIFKETTAIICGTRHLRAFSQNFNTGIGAVCNLYCRFMTISMFGARKTQPKYYFQSGTTTGVLLKIGVGSLHSIVLSGVQNNATVTLYDGTSNAGSIIWSSGAMTNQTIPFVIPFNDGINFENGLYLVVSAANCNAQVIYE